MAILLVQHVAQWLQDPGLSALQHLLDLADNLSLSSRAPHERKAL